MLEILKLIETLAATLTPDNIEHAVSLVEKLVALAQTIKQDISQPKV